MSDVMVEFPRDMKVTVEVGTMGPQGKSAYQIAIEQGFKGSEKEWLQSLKGDKGDKGEPGAAGKDGEVGKPGQDGKTAYEIWREKPDNADKSVDEFLASLKGEKGEPGEQGKQGDKGDPFTFSDLTEEQIASLSSEVAKKGSGMTLDVQRFKKALLDFGIPAMTNDEYISLMFDKLAKEVTARKINLLGWAYIEDFGDIEIFENTSFAITITAGRDPELESPFPKSWAAHIGEETFSIGSDGAIAINHPGLSKGQYPLLIGQTPETSVELMKVDVWGKDGDRYKVKLFAEDEKATTLELNGIDEDMDSSYLHRKIGDRTIDKLIVNNGNKAVIPAKITVKDFEIKGLTSYDSERKGESYFGYFERASISALRLPDLVQTSRVLAHTEYNGMKFDVLEAVYAPKLLNLNEDNLISFRHIDAFIKLTKLVVADNCEINLDEYHLRRIKEKTPKLKIYNPDETKTYDFEKKTWVEV